MNDVWTVGGLALLLVLTAACIWLVIDNASLRAQNKDLASKLQFSINTQAELVSVLKAVVQGELDTAYNKEREKIFVDALVKLNQIERNVVINNNLTQEKRDGGLDVSGGSVDVKGDAVGGNERKA